MRTKQITQMLGGTKSLGGAIRGRNDLIALSRRGVKKAALIALAQRLDLSMTQMAGLLPATERTIQRAAMSTLMSPPVSEQALHIAQAAARGEEVLGGRAAFLEWLNEPNQALGRRAPIELLNTRFGVEAVLDELGRIEHGIIS